MSKSRIQLSTAPKRCSRTAELPRSSFTRSNGRPSLRTQMGHRMDFGRRTEGGEPVAIGRIRAVGQDIAKRPEVAPHVVEHAVQHDPQPGFVRGGDEAPERLGRCPAGGRGASSRPCRSRGPWTRTPARGTAQCSRARGCGRASPSACPAARLAPRRSRLRAGAPAARAGRRGRRRRRAPNRSRRFLEPQFHQDAVHAAGGLAAVRDAVLCLGGPFAQGAAAGRLHRRFEDRVVAKAAGSLGAAAIRPSIVPWDIRTGCPPREPRASATRAPARTGTAPRAGGIQAAQGPEQLRVVLRVCGVLAGIAPRSHAGRAAQRVDFDARVVGQSGMPESAAKRRALIAALASNVSPSSIASSWMPTSSRSTSSARNPSNSRSSRSLWRSASQRAAATDRAPAPRPARHCLGPRPGRLPALPRGRLALGPRRTPRLGREEFLEAGRGRVQHRSTSARSNGLPSAVPWSST